MKMLTKKEQLIFVESRTIKDGVTNGNVWTLYGYKTQNGYEYSSLNSIPLNEPLFVTYTELEVPKKKGDGVFINRRIESVKSLDAVSKPASVPTQMDRLEAKIEEISDRVEDIYRAVQK